MHVRCPAKPSQGFWECATAPSASCAEASLGSQRMVMGQTSSSSPRAGSAALSTDASLPRPVSEEPVSVAEVVSPADLAAVEKLKAEVRNMYWRGAAQPESELVVADRHELLGPGQLCL